MRYFGLVITLFISTQLLAQSAKDSLIQAMELDTVIQYEGKGQLQNDNCLVLKYSGDITTFINEVVLMHVQNPDVVQRTQSTLYIPQTTKPYWVYGRYDVNVRWTKKKEYTLIEFWFYAYNRPGNYKIYGAAPYYQELVNKFVN